MKGDWEALLAQLQAMGLRVKSYNTGSGDIHCVVPRLEKQ